MRTAIVILLTAIASLLSVIALLILCLLLKGSGSAPARAPVPTAIESPFFFPEIGDPSLQTFPMPAPDPQEQRRLRTAPVPDPEERR